MLGPGPSVTRQEPVAACAAWEWGRWARAGVYLAQCPRPGAPPVARGIRGAGVWVELVQPGGSWGGDPPHDLSQVPADGPRPRPTACHKECVPWVNQHCLYLIVCLLTRSGTVRLRSCRFKFQGVVLRKVKKKVNFVIVSYITQYI